MSSKNERTQIEDCEPESSSVPSSPKKGKREIRSKIARGFRRFSSHTLSHTLCRVSKKKIAWILNSSRKGRFRKSCSKGKTRCLLPPSNKVIKGVSGVLFRPPRNVQRLPTQLAPPNVRRDSAHATVPPCMWPKRRQNIPLSRVPPYLVISRLPGVTSKPGRNGETLEIEARGTALGPGTGASVV